MIGMNEGAELGGDLAESLVMHVWKRLTNNFR